MRFTTTMVAATAAAFSLLLTLASGLDLDNLRKGLVDLTIDVHLGRSMNQDPASYFSQDLLSHLPEVKKYFTDPEYRQYKPKPTQKFNLACDGCVAGVETLIEMAHLGLNLDSLVSVLYKLCPLVLDKNVCHGAINNYAPSLLYIIENSRTMTGGGFCALAVGGKCGKWEEIWQWDVDFGNHTHDIKPPFSPPMPPKDGSKRGKVLQLSDFHIDMSYQIGTDVDCGLPLCCMNNTHMATNPAQAAGDWGAYACDLPPWTAEDMIKHISQVHKEDDFEYIMLTGDAPAHDVWAQSRELNLHSAKFVVDLVKKYFPDKKVIPSLGNHDSFPCNNFAPSSITDSKLGIHWDYKGLAELYGNWWPSEEARASFEATGCYHFLLMPGFRVVVVNSNGYIGYNFWMNMDYEDPFGLLPWLYDVLLEAESNGEKVHIVSHAPPGDSSVVAGWGRNWAKVVDRFANTITGQFYGHTHNDQFILFYDEASNSVPINVGYVTPSVTTYTGLNPSYRIYTLDGPYSGASMEVIDVDTFVFNLTAANAAETDRPVYYKLYNHRENLKMENLYPEDFDDLAKRLVQDQDLYADFKRYFNSDSFGQHSRDKDTIICTMLQTSYFDTRKCEEILGHPVDF